jgi:putative acetyltransferase
VPVTKDPDLHRARTRYLGHLDAVKAPLSPREDLRLVEPAALELRAGQRHGHESVEAPGGAAEACDEPLVGLLGEPAYYRRFGFVPATDLGIEAPDPAWGEYFQVRPLWSYGPALRGRFRYAPPFDDL